MHDEHRHCREVIDRLLFTINKLSSVLCRCCCGVHVADGEMNLAITEFHGRTTMADQVLPAIKLLDTEKVLLSVSPKNPDGTDFAGTVNWESSDPASVTLEVQPDTLTAWALTPNETGASTIKTSATGIRTAKVDISYGPPIVGEMNLSAGNPTPE